MEKNNKIVLRKLESTQSTEKIVSDVNNKERKPKKYKRGILYNGQLYTQLKTSKQSSVRVKNVLSIGSSFYVECNKYLLNGKYFNIDKDMIAYLLKKRIYVEYPTDSTLIDLCKTYESIGITDDAKKLLEKSLAGKLPPPWTSSCIFELVSLKRDRMEYENSMEKIKYASELSLLNNIKCLLEMGRYIIDIRKSFQTLHLSKMSAYHGTFADVATCNSGKFPQIAIVEYPEIDLILNGGYYATSDCGVIFKMTDVCGSLPILLANKELRKINSIKTYDEFIQKIQNREIGKIVGRDIYISPYDYAMIFVNPLKDIESVVDRA